MPNSVVCCYVCLFARCVDGNATLLNVVRKDSWNYVLQKFDFDALFNELCTQVTDHLVDSGSTVSRIELVVQQLMEMVEAAVMVRGTWSRQSIIVSVIDSISAAITQPPLMQLVSLCLSYMYVKYEIYSSCYVVSVISLLCASWPCLLCSVQRVWLSAKF